MARQYGRLNKGEQAAYDEVGYRVRARPIGWGRRAGFGLAFVALFVAMVGLDAADKADSRKLAARLNGPLSTWTNPETGSTARITPEWQHKQETTADGLVVHQFVQHTGHAVVVMTSEDLDGMSLAQYARALTDFMADEWKIPGGYLEDFRGHPSWIASAEQDGGSVRIRIRLVQVADKAWRVTTIQSTPMEYTDNLVHSLNTKLWRTVVPD